MQTQAAYPYPQAQREVPILPLPWVTRGKPLEHNAQFQLAPLSAPPGVDTQNHYSSVGNSFHGPVADLNKSYLLPFTGLTVFSSIKPLFTNCQSVFLGISGVLLSSLIFVADLDFFEKIWVELSNMGYIGLAVKLIVMVLCFVLNFLLMIRRAIKSADLYDRIFSCIAKHYLSIISYFIIFALSVVLIYCVGDCTISCDAPRYLEI